MRYVHVYALFLLLACHTACGQNQISPPPDNVSKRHYTESQIKEAATSRVPMSMVRNVRQARNGDILIASYLGVFRYDARLNNGAGQEASFTNITSKLISPRFASFWDVLEDRKGNFWFGTKDSGAYLLPSGQATFQHFTTKDGLVSNTALHIYEDKAGNIWFGTIDGAGRYDGKSFQNFTTKDGLPNNDITNFMEDKTGKLWIGSRGELSFYDGKTFTVLKNKDGKTFRNVWGITEDRKGNIWFGDVDGLWRYDPSAALRTGSGSFNQVSQRGAYAIIEDKEGNIWTTGDTGEVNSKGKVWAVSRYDAKSLYNKNPAVTEIASGGPFSGILEANDGSIWFGGMEPESVVHRYDGKTVTDFKNAAGQQ